MYDHVLEGWEPLRSANRIFVVVNARKYTLADVLKQARLGDAPAPIEIATFEAGRVYLISRE
jgi:hypothetical protein